MSKPTWHSLKFPENPVDLGRVWPNWPEFLRRIVYLCILMGEGLLTEKVIHCSTENGLKLGRLHCFGVVLITRILVLRLQRILMQETRCNNPTITG